MKRQSRPALITDAERSQDDQIHSREVRYVLMMGIRALFLVATAILAAVHAPMLGLWIPICLVALIVVPWLAVILANDGPPKPKYRLANRLRRARTGPGHSPAGVPGAAADRDEDFDWGPNSAWQQDWDQDQDRDEAADRPGNTHQNNGHQDWDPSRSRIIDAEP